MIIIDIDIAISKTNMIIFEIDIAYVSNLAHAWHVAIRKYDSQQTTFNTVVMMSVIRLRVVAPL
jgi:hypothetical protein